MTNADIQPSHQVNLNNIVSNLQTLREQMAGIESIDADAARARAQLESVKRQLEGAKGEVREALHYRDKYLAEAKEKLAESERLDKEIKEKSVVAKQANDYINKLRQQLG